MEVLKEQSHSLLLYLESLEQTEKLGYPIAEKNRGGKKQ